jgi:hypothetical protein
MLAARIVTLGGSRSRALEPAGSFLPAGWERKCRRSALASKKSAGARPDGSGPGDQRAERSEGRSGRRRSGSVTAASPQQSVAEAARGPE